MKFLKENKFDLTKLTEEQHRFLNIKFYDDYLKSKGLSLENEERNKLYFDTLFKYKLLKGEFCHGDFRTFIYQLRNNDNLFEIYTFLYDMYCVHPDEFRSENVVSVCNEILSCSYN